MKTKSMTVAKYIGHECLCKARMLVPIQQSGTFNRLTKGEVVDLTDVNNLPGRADGRNQYFATRYTTLQGKELVSSVV